MTINFSLRIIAELRRIWMVQRLLVKAVFVLALVLFGFNTPIYSKTYVVDKDHSHVGFSIKHMGIATVRGKFNDFKGTIQWSPEDEKQKLQIDGEVDARTIDTNNEKRDKHLKSRDFFNVRKFKTITLSTSKAIKKSEKANIFSVEAYLTLTGVTEPVKGKVIVIDRNLTHKGRRVISLQGSFSFDRMEYGMVYNKLMDWGDFLIGNIVHVTIDIEAYEK